MYSRRPAGEEARIVKLSPSVPGRLRPCRIFSAGRASRCRFAKTSAGIESTENVGHAYGKLHFQDSAGKGQIDPAGRFQVKSRKRTFHVFDHSFNATFPKSCSANW